MAEIRIVLLRAPQFRDNETFCIELTCCQVCKSHTLELSYCVRRSFETMKSTIHKKHKK